MYVLFNKIVSVAEVQNMDEAAQTQELRVDPYESVTVCMRAIEQTHERLMQALMVKTKYTYFCCFLFYY